DAAARRVKETLDYFRSHALPSFIWWFDAGTEASAWGPLLEAHGLTLDRSIPGMAAALESLHDPPDAEIQVRRVTNRRERALWAETFVVGYGFPREWAPLVADLFGGLDGRDAYHGYIAFDRGVAVATSTLFLSAGVAGLYDVATLPEARGR